MIFLILGQYFKYPHITTLYTTYQPFCQAKTSWKKLMIGMSTFSGLSHRLTGLGVTLTDFSVSSV